MRGLGGEPAPSVLHRFEVATQKAVVGRESLGLMSYYVIEVRAICYNDIREEYGVVL